MIERNCPNCKRETEDQHETICLNCGHATHKAPPKKRRSFKDQTSTKGDSDVSKDPGSSKD